MITYDDIHNPNYETLTDDYNSEYDDAMGPYYGNPKLIQDVKQLQKVSLASLGFSPKGVKGELIGITGSLIDPVTNKPYPDSLYEECIEEAVSWIEEVLDISIRPRLVVERDDYNQVDYTNYMSVRTNTRPIIQIEDCRLVFNNNSVIEYPDGWIKDNNRFGFFRMQPTALMAPTSGGIIQTPTLIAPFNNPNAGMPYGNDNYAPQLIGVSYIAGMLPRDPRDAGIQRDWYVPYSLKAVVNKRAAILILERWGRDVLEPGISGYSVGIDGINSSISSTQSATNTGSSADIRLLNNDIQPFLKALKAYYGYNVGILA